MSVKFGDDIVDSLVDIELFAAEDVDEGGVPIGECVNTDMALRDYNESADSPLGRILARSVDESVGRADLVHPDNVRQLV